MSGKKQTLIRITRDFVFKNIKSLFRDVEKNHNDYEQSKLCLLISHKQPLQQKFGKHSKLPESVGETIENDTQFDYELELFSQNEKSLIKNWLY